jgi:TPR repeat protein
MRKATVLLLALMLTGCIHTNEAGLRAYNTGDYEKAYEHWAPLAAQGDLAAIHNMGLLWEKGLSTHTPKNEERAAEYYLKAARQNFVPSMISLANYQLEHGARPAAISWLKLAARWNEQTAVATLSRLGEEIPGPDLAVAQQQAELQSQQILGAAILCAAVGCNPAYSVPQRQAPTSFKPKPSMMMCPDGSFVYGTRCQIAPNGSFIGVTE